MKILRTGRDGQVRFELQRSLAPLGEVVAVDHADCDLSDAQAIRNLVARVRPDVIVSPAAYTAVDKAESDQDRAAAINVVAPGILGEEAAQLVRQWQREDEGAFPYSTYHCVAGGETNWCDYARYVIGAAIRSGKPLKMQPEGIKPITTADYPTPAKRPGNSRLDTRKFRDTFGLELPHWQAGLDHIIQQIF
jgi:dTDP-4-dehydrorhamnose reductase